MYEDLYSKSTDLQKSVVFPLYLCAKELTRKYGEKLSKYDLTYTQYVVMMYFYHEGSSNLKNIGKVMLLDSSTLTPLLKKLEKKGLLTRTKSSTDERNLIIKLTKKGKEMEPKLRSVLQEVDDLIDFSKEEKETLHNIASKLISTLVEGENSK